MRRLLNLGISGAIVLLLTACSSMVSQEDNEVASSYNVKLGLAYLRQQEMPRAKEKLLLALQQAPNWSVALDAMAYYFEVTGDNKNAEFYYAKAIKEAPENGASLNNYGDFLCRKGQVNEAINLFVKAAEQQNYIHSAQAYENAGLCALSASQWHTADLYFHKALQQDPKRETAWLGMAKVDSVQGQQSGAENDLKQYKMLIEESNEKSH